MEAITTGITQMGTEILLGILIPMLGVLLNKAIDAFKIWANAKADVLQKDYNVQIEETARARLFGALDTAAELVLASLNDLKDLDRPNGQNALKAGLDHVKSSMSESIGVLKATEGDLMNVLKKNVLLKAGEVVDGFRGSVEGIMSRD